MCQWAAPPPFTARGDLEEGPSEIAGSDFAEPKPTSGWNFKGKSYSLPFCNILSIRGIWYENRHRQPRPDFRQIHSRHRRHRKTMRQRIQHKQVNSSHRCHLTPWQYRQSSQRKSATGTWQKQNRETSSGRWGNKKKIQAKLKGSPSTPSFHYIINLSVTLWQLS